MLFIPFCSLFLFIWRRVIWILLIALFFRLFVVLKITLNLVISLFVFNLLRLVVIHDRLTEWLGNFTENNIIEMVIVIVSKVRSTKTNLECQTIEHAKLFPKSYLNKSKKYPGCSLSVLLYIEMTLFEWKNLTIILHNHREYLLFMIRILTRTSIYILIIIHIKAFFFLLCPWRSIYSTNYLYYLVFFINSFVL